MVSGQLVVVSGNASDCKDSRNAIRAIFFDFDGVLVDNEFLHYECWAEVLDGHGMPFTSAFYFSKLAGVSPQKMVEIICRHFGKNYSEQFFTTCYMRKKALYDRRVQSFCRIPGELVSFLKDAVTKYKLAVVSSSTRSDVEPYLIEGGIRNLFSAVVCQEDVRRLKPAPDPYLHALELVNNWVAPKIQKAECLVTEDSDPGVQSACLAGMQVVRVSGPTEVLKVLRTVLSVCRQG
jgi:beta-phosphoglucomutase-like phosphatase (HAD superfamily)